MSSSSGAPPKGTTESVEVEPSATPSKGTTESVEVEASDAAIGTSAVDENWFDVDVELPPDLPASIDGATPHAVDATASFEARAKGEDDEENEDENAAGAHGDRAGSDATRVESTRGSRATEPSHTRSRNVFIAAAAAILVAAVAIPLAKPSRAIRALPPRAAQPARQSPAIGAASAADDAPPLVTAAAPSRPPMAASAEVGAGMSAAPSADGFAEAFQRNAAKKDAKWGEIKVPVAKPASSALPSASAATPTNAHQPGAANPLDVLKRLEDVRKSKRQ